MLVKRLRLVAVIATIVARRTSESVDGMLLTATGVLLFATHNSFSYYRRHFPLAPLESFSTLVSRTNGHSL